MTQNYFVRFKTLYCIKTLIRTIYELKKVRIFLENDQLKYAKCPFIKFCNEIDLIDLLFLI